MKNKYAYDPKTREMAPADRATKWRKPTKKTAIELLETDDSKPGLLSSLQRKKLEIKAGKAGTGRKSGYKKPKESAQEYVNRIRKAYYEGKQ